MDSKKIKPPSSSPPTEDGSTTTPEATATAEPTETPSSPLVDYLSGGYYKGEGAARYPAPKLVDHAEEIGKALGASGVSATAFNRMLRTLKEARRKPYEAQEGALKKLTIQVLDLENRKKAPAILREVVERNRAAVKDSQDFAACLDHFRDIGVFLAAEQK